MKYSVNLPEKGPKPKYYETHIRYVKRILEYLRIPYTLSGSAVFNIFSMDVNGKGIAIDFSDHYRIYSDFIKYPIYFKFHYSKLRHSKLPNVHPISPVSFYNWPRFFTLKKEIKYSCNNNLVINMQHPSGAAVKRRRGVQKLLKKQYKNEAITTCRAQVDFWKTVDNCLVHVCVPGARNDILDRGQIQCMAFGCCTISPFIGDVIAYDEELIPGVHYIQCQADYSDLLEKIEWCKKNRNQCIEIGENASKLFEATSTPDKLWQWILKWYEKENCK